MGLTNDSVGKGALGRSVSSKRKPTRTVALAGNPNVGKSTLFNALTGMNQHTGNWPGKTVSLTEGMCKCGEAEVLLVDLPGTYSLLAHSPEEEVARDYLCFKRPDMVVVVCDATSPERSLNLALQVMECCPNTVLCFNLMDEAAKKGINIDLPLLERRLQIPVLDTVAHKKKTQADLRNLLEKGYPKDFHPSHPLLYPSWLETRLCTWAERLAVLSVKNLSPRWLTLRAMEDSGDLPEEIQRYLGVEFTESEEWLELSGEMKSFLAEIQLTKEGLQDLLRRTAVDRAEQLCQEVVVREPKDRAALDRKLDNLITGKRTAYPLMLLLLAGILWLTIYGANYPSQWLNLLFSRILEGTNAFLIRLHAPSWLIGITVDGILRVLFWVVAVMLPPMAIFFPLFTLLEDAGLLPRIAYNLDRPFQRCNACGKQALTMCMGFGCNAAGVVGCRIIDSPRERLLAILTNSLIPCNGRFPALIAIITMFFVGFGGSFASSLAAGLLLTLLILLAIFAVFATTKLLSVTLLRGLPSSFTLELPPYRMPQPGKILVRSVIDRVLFVLGRSVAVAAPAGMVLWLLANLEFGGTPLLKGVSYFLDPVGRLLGMDGVILLAFILALPANEIAIPIMLMIYLGQGTLTEAGSLMQTREILIANGWTPVTACCVLIFFLFHWPCSTTLLTVKKETGSIPWTVTAALLPTALGILICIAIRATTTLLGIP